MSPEELEAIRGRAADPRTFAECISEGTQQALTDRAALLSEVDRLRSELDGIVGAARNLADQAHEARFAG